MHLLGGGYNWIIFYYFENKTRSFAAFDYRYESLYAYSTRKLASIRMIGPLFSIPVWRPYLHHFDWPWVGIQRVHVTWFKPNRNYLRRYCVHLVIIHAILITHDRAWGLLGNTMRYSMYACRYASIILTSADVWEAVIWTESDTLLIKFELERIHLNYIS